MEQRLMVDLEIICYSEEHWKVAVFAFLGLLVISLGIPFFIFWRIWRREDRQHASVLKVY